MGRSLNLIVILALALAVTSCGRQSSQQTSEDPYPDTSMTAGDPRIVTDGLTGEQTLPRTPSSPDMPDTGTAQNPAPIGGNRAEVRGQLRSEASRLDGLVKSGAFAAVANSATRVRDLAVSLGGKTAGLRRDNIMQIEQDISAITEITENMRLQATARKQEGVKAQNDLLQPVIARVVRLSA
jgi:hypothetical protein